MDLNVCAEKIFSYPQLGRKFFHHLTTHAQDVEYFYNLQTHIERINFVHHLLVLHNFLPKFLPDRKCNKKSVKYRLEGNKMYKVRDHTTAHDFYTKSIVFGENGSEDLAKAFGNRSAVLFELKLYKECLKDIEMAFTNNCPSNLMEKLTVRKRKAQELVGTRTGFIYHGPIPEIPEESKHPDIECASNAIKMNHSTSKGRHIVATRDINIGETIAVEKPYIQILQDEKTKYCHECFAFCYTLIPCEKCTQALYCGKKCREDAFKSYHQYECTILKTVMKQDLYKLEYFASRVLLKGLQEQEQMENQTIYKSDRFYEINQLLGHIDKRVSMDLFASCISIAFIYHLIDTYTNFLQTDIARNKFKVMLLEQKYIALINMLPINEFKFGCSTETGYGLYSFLSMFNHSCAPNVKAVCYGSTMEIRALDFIKNGQECCLVYDSMHFAMYSKRTRQMLISNHYFFDCKCVACVKDWPTYARLPTYGSWDGDSFVNTVERSIRNTEKRKKLLAECSRRIKNYKYPKPSKEVASLLKAVEICFEFDGNLRQNDLPVILNIIFEFCLRNIHRFN